MISTFQQAPFTTDASRRSFALPFGSACCVHCWHSRSRTKGILSSTLILNFHQIYRIFFFAKNFSIISCDTYFKLPIYFYSILREAEKFDSSSTWSAAWSILSRIKQQSFVLTQIPTFIEVCCGFFMLCLSDRQISKLSSYAQPCKKRNGVFRIKNNVIYIRSRRYGSANIWVK